MICKWKVQSSVNKTMRATAFKSLETENGQRKEMDRYLQEKKNYMVNQFLLAYC